LGNEKEEVLVTLTRQAVPGLADAIRAVHSGQTYMSPELVERWVGVKNAPTAGEVLTIASVLVSARRC
jgi:hypothetical protein